MSNEHKSYLSQLKFNPKLLESWHAKYLKNVRIVFLLILTILIAGIASYLNLPRRLNPEVKIPIVTISTVLPGAGPSDVESLVTKPIEDAVTGISAIDTVQSVSQENVSIITIQFLSSVNSDKAANDVQTAVNRVTDLPTDAKTPSVRALDFEDQPVWTFVLSTNADTGSLMRFAHELEDAIKRVTTVDRVTTSGLEHREIQIILEPEKIAQYQVDTQALSRVIRTALASQPAGSIRTETSNFPLTIDAPISSIDDIRSIILTTGNNPVKLSDIATVVEKSKVDEAGSYIVRKNAPIERAVTFSVFKTKSANIDRSVRDAQKVVDEAIKPYNGSFTISTVLNTGEEIDKQSTDLVGEFKSTLILLFLILFIFLGIRQALIVSFTVPLTFLVTFGVMSAMGITINFLSLFSLLLALGLLVDDAIVIVAAMTAFYRTGKFTPYETGLLVWKDFIVPIWTTTITTVWAFLPLLISTGIIGEFIKTIPIVVATAMYTSTAIAVFITLPLMIIILKAKPPHRVIVLTKVLTIILILIGIIVLFKSNSLFPVVALFSIVFFIVTYKLRRLLIERFEKLSKRYVNIGRVKSFIVDKFQHGIINIHPLSNKYHRTIERIIVSDRARRNIIIVIAAYMIFSYALLPLGLIQNEFFPKADLNYIYMSLELPNGTNVETAEQETKTLLNTLKQEKISDFITADIGQGAPTGFGGGATGANQILITLVLPDKSMRKTSSIDFAQHLRDTYETYQRGKLSVVELSGGPPAGSDIQIQLRGDDLLTLDQYADKATKYLETIPGVTNINKSIKSGTSKIVFEPDTIKIAQAGTTLDAVGAQLRMFASGIPMGNLKKGDDTTDIVFRVNMGTEYIENLSRISIATKDGLIPLSQLGKFVVKVNPSLITREDNKRTLSVAAAVEKGYTPVEINQKLEQFAKTGLHLPDSYEWKTGGVNEENQKSVQSILQAMVLASILIFATMVVQFNSYRKAIIVLLVIPIAISSVFFIFALTGTPLSFPALIGLLALFGIVVTHGMVVMEKINQNIRFGMKLKDAITDASQSRLEPIMLTSLATIFGLIPITLADPLWRGLGGAIIAGLLFSGLIKLFFIPVVYYQWFKSENRK